MRCPDVRYDPDPIDPSSTLYRLALSVALLVASASLAMSIVQTAKLQRDLDDVAAAVAGLDDYARSTRREVRDLRHPITVARGLAMESMAVAGHAHTRLDRIHSTNGYTFESGGRKMDLLCVDAEPEAKPSPTPPPTPNYEITGNVSMTYIGGTGHLLADDRYVIKTFKPTIRRLP